MGPAFPALELKDIPLANPEIIGQGLGRNSQAPRHFDKLYIGFCQLGPGVALPHPRASGRPVQPNVGSALYGFEMPGLNAAPTSAIMVSVFVFGHRTVEHCADQARHADGLAADRGDRVAASAQGALPDQAPALLLGQLPQPLPDLLSSRDSTLTLTARPGREIVSLLM